MNSEAIDRSLSRVLRSNTDLRNLSINAGADPEAVNSAAALGAAAAQTLAESARGSQSILDSMAAIDPGYVVTFTRQSMAGLMSIDVTAPDGQRDFYISGDWFEVEQVFHAYAELFKPDPPEEASDD